MAIVTYKTEYATFRFPFNEVKDCLTHYISEHNIGIATHILNTITTSNNDHIEIPEDCDYFGYIALDLISKGEGTVNCKICNQTYKPEDLNKIILGHGESPFKINIKLEKGGIIKRLFGKKQKRVGMFGGKGFKCPKGHELITMRTWIT